MDFSISEEQRAFVDTVRRVWQKDFKARAARYLDGEIGNRIKGRQALIDQAKRDHEKYSAPPGPDGKVSSIMRHIISNRMVNLTGPDTAEGSCYVITIINDKTDGPLVMSLSRYVDRYARTKDGWRIAHRDIVLESGNREIGKRFGFGR